MKRLIFILFIGLYTMIYAQEPQIDNYNFEQWSDNTHPQTWNCSYNLSGFEISTGHRTTDAPEGNYAIKIETQQIFGYTAPGIVQLGEILITDSIEVTGGYRLEARPDGLRFFAKYMPSDNDTAIMFAMLTKYDNNTHRRDTIASTAMIFYEQMDNYREYLIPFFYKNENDTADTINIIFLSSNPINPKVGSQLYVDDVELLYGFVAYPTFVLPPRDITDTSFIARWFPSPLSNQYYLDVATDPQFNNILPNYNNLLVIDTNEQYIQIPDYQPDDLYYRVRVKYGDTAVSPNSQIMLVIPPYPVICLNATNITPGEEFTAIWYNRKNALNYYLDVASDSLFTNYLNGYRNLNVGTDTSYIVNNLGNDSIYYYRIRAEYQTGISPNSNIIKVIVLLAKQRQIQNNLKYFINGNKLIITGLKNSNIKVYDLNGRLLINRKNISSRAEFSFPNPGIYILTIKHKNQLKTIKIKI